MTFPEWHVVLDYATRAVAVCAVLHTFLPPWDWKPQFVVEGLADFPAVQNLFFKSIHNRYYKLLIYTIGYIAINGRSTIWKGISVEKQMNGAVNQAATKIAENLSRNPSVLNGSSPPNS